mmetsp:Transcript_685/g.2508  ORF Transcript_685/g.2508 Transcript_685/m.2508 type:complete len:234 (-) Transcript_685:2517-3218(-)
MGPGVLAAVLPGAGGGAGGVAGGVLVHAAAAHAQGGAQVEVPGPPRRLHAPRAQRRRRGLLPRPAPRPPARGAGEPRVRGAAAAAAAGPGGQLRQQRRAVRDQGPRGAPGAHRRAHLHARHPRRRQRGHPRRRERGPHAGRGQGGGRAGGLDAGRAAGGADARGGQAGRAAAAGALRHRVHAQGPSLPVLLGPHPARPAGPTARAEDHLGERPAAVPGRDHLPDGLERLRPRL